MLCTSRDPDCAKAPFGQFEHCDRPDWLLKVPNGQTSQTVAASLEKVLSGHCWQDVLAFSSLNVPGGQEKQKDVFCTEYWPGWQNWQSVAPRMVEKVPAGHGVQVVLEFRFEKVP